MFLFIFETGGGEMSPGYSSVFNISQSPLSASNVSVAATAGTHCDMNWHSVTDGEGDGGEEGDLKIFYIHFLNIFCLFLSFGILFLVWFRNTLIFDKFEQCD